MKNIETVAFVKSFVPGGIRGCSGMPTKKPLKQYSANLENSGDDFLTRKVTGDETWLHHFEPEMKRQSMDWHHANSPKKKN